MNSNLEHLAKSGAVLKQQKLSFAVSQKSSRRLIAIFFASVVGTAMICWLYFLSWGLLSLGRWLLDILKS